MNTATETARHPRWKHLPAQPWRYTGQTREIFQAVPGAPDCPIQPGTSCDHCGQGIMDVYHFEATATGERFKVGCDCVRRMQQEMATPSRALSAAETAARATHNANARARSAVKAAAVKADLDALLADEAVRALLAAQPHPSSYRAERGETRLDSMEWMAANAGASGRAKTLKAIREAVGS